MDGLADAGPALLAERPTPYDALTSWIDQFVDFLATKHGLAAVLQSDDPRFDPLHAYFLDRLVPVCAELLDRAAGAGQIQAGQSAVELMRGVGSLCAGATGGPDYDARRMVDLLVAGLRI